MEGHQQTQWQMHIRNQNLDFTHKKVLLDDNAKSVKTTVKKGGPLSTRKPLIDITNKSVLRAEASSRRNIVPKEEFDIAGEAFLHDHSKCIEADEATHARFVLNTLLPKSDFIVLADDESSEQSNDDDDLLSPSSHSFWKSPPGSPMLWKRANSPSPLDSPLASPFSWKLEADDELVMKPEDRLIDPILECVD